MPNRSFTNSVGEVVTVDTAHLEFAVNVKLELQNSSPSRRCNWATHKALMEGEGFLDSDTSEAYRCLVKDYQKEIGKLHSLPKHADLIASHKLDAIKQTVGEMYYIKRENQEILSEMNKIKRDLTRTAIVTEMIREVMVDDIDFNIPHYVFEPKIAKSANKAIVTLTDLHVGAVVHNVFGNYYDYEIAKKRLNLYTQKILDYCNVFGITEIMVCGLGDYVEHYNMRYKQNEEAEFKLAEQINKATKLIIDFLVGLAEYVNVEYTAIAGNHDRMQGDKNIAYEDDNVTVIINYNIKTFIELTKAERLTFVNIENGKSEINKVVNGKKIRMVHGHLDNGNKKDRLQAYISMTNDFIDMLMFGHLHNFKVDESDNGRMVVGVGSFIGRNNYSKELKCATNASQTMLVVTGTGDMLPLRIDLQIV